MPETKQPFTPLLSDKSEIGDTKQLLFPFIPDIFRFVFYLFTKWVQHQSMNASHRRLLKEFKGLSKESPSLKLQGIHLIQPIDPTDLYHWEAFIQGPPNSPYHESTFKLLILIPNVYPLEPPKMKFEFIQDIDKLKSINSGLQKINPPTCYYFPHANIHPQTGSICLDILTSEKWSPAWTLQTATLAVIMLLGDPEPDSPLNVDMANMVRSDDRLALQSLISYYLGKYSAV